MNVPASLCLVIFAAGCATGEPSPLTRTQWVCADVPERYLQPCTVPEFVGETWGEGVRYAVELKAALRQCDADKTAIRESLEVCRRLYPASETGAPPLR